MIENFAMKIKKAGGQAFGISLWLARCHKWRRKKKLDSSNNLWD